MCGSVACDERLPGMNHVALFDIHDERLPGMNHVAVSDIIMS